MTTVNLCPTFGVGYQAFDANGLPLNAGTISTYIAGGTTPQATYTTIAGNVQNANAIVLGVDGRPPNEIWLIAGAAYRFDVKDSLGNLVKTYDNISGSIDSSVLAGSSGSSLIGFIASGVGAVIRLVQNKLRDAVDIDDFGGDTTYAIDNAPLFANAFAAHSHVRVSNPGTYRVDDTVVVPAGKTLEVLTGCGIRRSTAHSANTTPVIHVQGARSNLIGDGDIVTENNHPQGIVVCGHRDNTTVAYDGQRWKLIGLHLYGVASAGNIGVWVPSGQVLDSTRSNYFGIMDEIDVNGAGTAYLFDEYANGHQCGNLFAQNISTIGLELRGCYANKIDGFWLSSSTNGVIGLKLTDGVHQATQYNIVHGVFIEPGGAASVGVNIGDNCNFNDIEMLDNASGGYFPGTGYNAIKFYPDDFYLHPSSVLKPHLGCTTDLRPDLTGKLYLGNTRRYTLAAAVKAENTQYDMFTLAPATNTAALVRVRATFISAAGLDEGVSEALYWVRRNFAGTVTVGTAYSHNGGKGFLANAPQVTGTTACFAASVFNNGTGTNYTVNVDVDVSSANVDNIPLTQSGGAATGSPVFVGGYQIGDTLTLPTLGAGGGLVSVGASDSGGTGYRLLRVPN